MRPRFFAGQLLTEDDLSALVDYFVAKNRFHNSRLFGEGVVCGLLVECGPCEGQIVVDPGYALDCCGNDLVLTCHQTLDIAPMIRELAAHKDCGCTDPCEEPTIGKTSGGDNDDKQEVEARPKPCRKYCLYARYAERPDQPVAAYPVGGDCDAASCEPTRVVEGIVFELRCDAKPHVPTFDDVRDCCDDVEDGKYRMLRAASALQHMAMVAELSLDTSKTLRPQYAKLLHEAVDLDQQAGSVPVEDRPVYLARYSATVGAILAHAARNKIELKGFDVDTLQGNLRAIAKRLSDVDVKDMDPLDRAVVLDAASSDSVERSSLERSTAERIAAPLISEAYMREARDQIQYIMKKVQARPDCAARKVRTHCGVSTRTDQLGQFRAVTAPDAIRQMYDDALDTVQVIGHFWGDCECAAINPPCPPCDDPGVLLACIEVDHCKVVSICNTVREYVYAPSTLRYWGAVPSPSRFTSWFCCGPRRGWREPVNTKAQKALGREQAMRVLAEMADDSPPLATWITPVRYAAVPEQPTEGDLAVAAPKATVERKKEKSEKKKDGDK